MNSTKRKLPAVISAALLSLTAFLFVPAQIQLPNVRHSPFTFLDILGPLALLVLLSFILVTVGGLTKSSALPAMLVKGIGLRYALQYDDRPVTLDDYPASIAGSLGFEHEFPGIDFLNGIVDPERERIFYHHEGCEPNSAGFLDNFSSTG
jgi:hypothetical protein